ncbi:hypothetical protein BU15DRAFT_66455 [Melanogaster broomeanus]|nr:hypothetical protein BU15DRAFT_66455 [Melanogaster broomeanus]
MTMTRSTRRTQYNTTRRNDPDTTQHLVHSHIQAHMFTTFHYQLNGLRINVMDRQSEHKSQQPERQVANTPHVQPRRDTHHSTRTRVFRRFTSTRRAGNMHLKNPNDAIRHHTTGRFPTRRICSHDDNDN